MEKRSSSFEDHLDIVTSHEKTAGAKQNKNGGSLLEKLAKELNLGSEAEKTAAESVTAESAPSNEGEVHPAESSVSGAPDAVVSATEGVATPQTTIAGGNPAEAAAGEMPAATKPNEGLAISAGDGKVIDANSLHRTPEAVAAAAMDGGGNEGAAAAIEPEKDGQIPDSEKTAEAKQIGQIIAKSFQETLEKQAEAADYSEALGILKEAGYLKGYDIKDEGMDKTASYEKGGLEKLANKKSLSRQEVIGAAVEYLEMQKEAEDAEEAGREDARNVVAAIQEIQKQASSKEEPAAKSNASEEGTEKLASLLQNPEVVAAVRVLKKHNAI